MNPEEVPRVIKLIGDKVTDEIAPQVQEWVERTVEIQADIRAQYRQALTEIHEEIKSAVVDDHLEFFGAIMATCNIGSPLSAMLAEYDTAGLRLLEQMNDFLGDKEENDERRMRAVRSITDPSGPELIGPGRPHPNAIQLGESDDTQSDRGPGSRRSPSDKDGNQESGGGGDSTVTVHPALDLAD